MANAKVTVADNYATVKAFLEQNGADQTLIDFIVDRAEKSVRKASSKPKAPTDEQVALRNAILEVLGANGSPMSITEMQKANDIIGACSTSKVTANLGTMLVNGKTPNENGKIVRSMDKKTAKFALA